MPSSSSANRAQQQRSLQPCRAQHFRAPPATGHHQGVRGRQRARAFADARGYQLARRGAGERIALAATARTTSAVVSPHRLRRHPLRHHLRPRVLQRGENQDRHHHDTADHDDVLDAPADHDDTADYDGPDDYLDAPAGHDSASDN